VGDGRATALKSECRSNYQVTIKVLRQVKHQKPMCSAAVSPTKREVRWLVARLHQFAEMPPR
jgi:hypothetical protein